MTAAAIRKKNSTVRDGTDLSKVQQDRRPEVLPCNLPEEET